MVSWPWPWFLVPISRVAPPLRVEADLGELGAGAGRALDGVDDAEAAQLAARRRCLAPRREAGDVAELAAAMSMLRGNSPQS